MSLPTGARIGPYEITRALGTGGMGEVYRARDPRLQRDVAIKILHADVARDADRVRRFEQEARALGQLNHPNLLATYDTGHLPDNLPGAGSPFIVSELLEGHTLRDELDSRLLPLHTVLTFARDIVEGLSAAHDSGIVHRDLKPANLYVTRAGRIKILDFGLAKLRPRTGAEDLTTLREQPTEAGVIVGTTAYMAPEQVRGQAVDHRTDIFAFGCVLYEMLAGRRAFQADTHADTMSAILTRDPPPIARPADEPEVPAGLDRIVRRCLEKSPDRRFQSARDLAFSLDAGTESPTAAQHSETTPPPAQRPRKGLRMLIVGAALAAVAAMGWATYPWSSTSRGSSAGAPATVTPFIVGAAVEGQPAWSPAGNFIAFASDEAGSVDVWLVDVSGANPINLTKDFGGRDSFPAWSPDGTRIAFYSDREDGGIYTMTPLGSDVRKAVSVPPSAFYTFSLQWAHNGSLIYTTFDESGLKQIYSASPDSAPTCLTCRAKVSSGRDAELSPSGRLLAFVGPLIGPRPPLYVLNLESGVVHEIADRTDGPHWQADDRLLFLSTRDGLADVWEVRIDPRSGERRSDPARITSGLDATAFAVSADGRQVLAVKEKSTSSIWMFPTSAEFIDDTAAGTELTTGDVRDGRPRWSSDGREVYFESNRRGSIDVWKVPVSGGTPVRITSATTPEQRPRPSPDRKWLAFDVDGNWLWIARADGSAAQEAFNWRSRYSNTCCAAWSPRGSSLILSVTRLDGAGALTLADFDPATGKVTSLKDVDMPGALEEYARWAPDGQSVLYEAFNNGSWNMWLADGNLGKPVQLTHAPGNERQGAWQDQPRMIYFRTDHDEIWRVAIGSGASRPVHWLSIRGRQLGSDSIDISADSKHLVVSLVKPESDLWMLAR